MKDEARHTIILGFFLIGLGIVAYVWAERETVRSRLSTIETPEFQFGQFRRDEMIQEEHDTADDAGA